MLRGYSPSKHRWKIATATNGGAASKQNGTHTSGNYSHGGSASHGHSGSNFGGTNPNVYTRSTKHTPAHSSKVWNVRLDDCGGKWTSLRCKKIRRWSAKAYRKYARSSCFKRASKTTIGRNCGRRGHATHKAARPTAQHKSTLQNNRYGLHLFITLLDWIWYRSFKLKAKIVINYKQVFTFAEK